MAPKVLLVDDDRKTADKFVKLLGREGFDIEAVYSYDEAVALLGRATFDLIIIDFVMPGNGGVMLAKYVYEHYPAMGIIIISCIPNVDLGRELIGIADDYVDKAQSIKPLVTSMRKVLKEKAEVNARPLERHAAIGEPVSGDSMRSSGSGSIPALRGKLSAGQLFMDFDKMEYRFGSITLDLAAEELWVLAGLAYDPNETVEVDYLANIIGKNRGRKADAARVRSVVHSLRNKIEPDPSNPRYLVTVRNGGYKLTVTEK